MIFFFNLKITFIYKTNNFVHYNPAMIFFNFNLEKYNEIIMAVYKRNLYKSVEYNKNYSVLV